MFKGQGKVRTYVPITQQLFLLAWGDPGPCGPHCSWTHAKCMSVHYKYVHTYV